MKRTTCPIPDGRQTPQTEWSKTYIKTKPNISSSKQNLAVFCVKQKYRIKKTEISTI